MQTAEKIISAVVCDSECEINEVTGTCVICGAKTVSDCDTCGSTGEVEEMEHIYDTDSNTTEEEGTGQFTPCPECHPYEPQHDTVEEANGER